MRRLRVVDGTVTAVDSCRAVNNVPSPTRPRTDCPATGLLTTLISESSSELILTKAPVLWPYPATVPATTRPAARAQANGRDCRCFSPGSMRVVTLLVYGLNFSRRPPPYAPTYTCLVVLKHSFDLGDASVCRRPPRCPLAKIHGTNAIAEVGA